MPDVFTRMQASTKASTLGLGCLLIGAALQMGEFASLIRVASIGAFVLLTTPVSGLVIARAAYFAGVPLWEGTVLDERKRDSLRATRGGLSAQDHNNEDLDGDHMKR
jgi:multicomponent Na+:H+ antiporter subunit G